MTVSSPPPFISRPEKRKYIPDNSYYNQFSPSPTTIHTEISPRVIKKIRPNPITAQSLRAKTVSRLFQGQRDYDLRDVEMTPPKHDERCAFCDSLIETGLSEEDATCLQCTRVVCGKCGVRQYLSEGDFVACLECVHHG